MIQRQATPPRPESSTRQIAPVTTLTAPKSASNIQTISPQHDDEATDEEEDVGSKPQEPIRNKAATHLTPLTRSPPASPTLVDDLSKKSAVTANSRNRLGAIGGSSVKTASPGPDKSSGNSTTSPAAEVQDPLSSKDSSPVRTASNEGHHDQHRSPISSASRGSASRGRLGIIGGKKRGYIAPETIIPSAETSLPLLPSKAHGRLGTIGGRGKEQPKSKDHLEQPLATEIPNVADFSGGPAPFATTQSVSKDPSPTAETAQEKADRKREELKRQLEKKASAPVKRQRRF